MHSSDEIVRQRQCAIRRQLDERAILLKVVSFDSGIPYETLLTYFPQEGGRKPVMLPASAIYALARGNAIPLDLLSLLVPGGFLIVRVPEAVDHDDAAKAVLEYLRAKDEAHHPESEDGRNIGPNEDKTLRTHLTVVRERAA